MTRKEQIEELAIELYKKYGDVELSTQRKVEWWELSPTSKRYWNNLVTYVLKRETDARIKEK